LTKNFSGYSEAKTPSARHRLVLTLLALELLNFLSLALDLGLILVDLTLLLLWSGA